MFGICFLLAFVVVIGKLEPRHKASIWLLFGLSFPIVYQLIADTGPVRYGLLMTAITPWVVQLIVRATTRTSLVTLNIVLGVLLFLAVEDKPFFLYLVPSVAILTLAYNTDPARGLLEEARALFTKTWICAVTFIGLVLLFLFEARTSNGATYFASLVHSVRQDSVRSVLVAFVSYMTNFAKFASMVYERTQLRVLNVSMSVTIWLPSLAFVGIAFRKTPLLRRKLALTVVALAIGILTMLVMRNAWTGHHFFYCFVLAVFVVAQAVSHVERNRTPFLAAYVLASIVTIVEIPFWDPGETSSWERYKVFDYLNQKEIGNNFVIAHLSMGTYYVASLYGQRDQLAVQIDRLDTTSASRLIELSETTKRRLLCVCHGSGCDAESLARKFLSRITFSEVPLSNRDWKVYSETNRLSASDSRPDAGAM